MNPDSVLGHWRAPIVFT